MKHLLQQARLESCIYCDSAGTSGYHIGEPPDGRMKLAAQKRGIVLNSRSRRFEVSDFEDFDLILAMDRANYRDILKQDATGQYHNKVKMMCDFCTQYPDKEVPDPYYGGDAGFRYVIELLLDACDGLLKACTSDV